MKKILDLFKTHKNFITWTICYVFVLWFIFYFMFGFNIFNTHQWHYLANAQFYGFVGFVFTALLFAALPIYISTSILIIRKKKPLITIPLPQLPALVTKKTETTPDAPTPSPEKTDSQPEPDITTNPDIPPEMMPAFISAKNHPLNISIAAPENATDATDIAQAQLPLPDDFDIDFTSDSTTNNNIPTFTDLDFDSTPENTTSTDITAYLNTQGIEYKIIDDIVITPTHAITTHNDSDFWVTDNENWFATGKTKPSPVIAVKYAAKQHNVKPILYLAETNIMDLETLIPQWESDGITVITSLTEL